MEYNVGVGLVDFMMTSNIDPNSGMEYPPWNVQNIKEYAKQYQSEQKVGAPPKIHIIKTNQHSAGKVFARIYLFSLTGEGMLTAC